MKVERVRPNVLALTATTQEVSALVAAGRLAADAMRGDPRAAEAVALLEGVLRDYDRAVARLEPGGPSSRPPGGALPRASSG